MMRQVVQTNWSGGQEPVHTYVDLGPARAVPAPRSHLNFGPTGDNGSGGHYKGTKSPPSISMQHHDGISTDEFDDV